MASLSSDAQKKFERSAFECRTFEIDFEVQFRPGAGIDRLAVEIRSTTEFDRMIAGRAIGEKQAVIQE